jgi:multidrug efflux system membrane fusion protein
MMTALFLCSCQSNQQLLQPPQGVQVQQVQAAPAQDADTQYSALVMPDTQVPLTFRIPGYVTSLIQVRGGDGRLRDIAEGDRVAKGAVLARLRAAEYEDKHRQMKSQAEVAQSAAQKAKIDFERATRLYETQSITKPEFDGARAQYDATQAQLRGAHALVAEAGIALRDTGLTTPISGDIIKKSIEVGSLVGPGALAFVVADTRVVKVLVGVPDVTVRMLKVGLPITVTVEALPNRVFKARISRIATAADPKTRNFDVEIAIPNADYALKAGMIASLQLATSEPKQPALVVPISAIVQSADGTYGVFVVAKGNGGEIARFRPVSVGSVRGSNIEVIRGLASGDAIVTMGAALLKDGQQVEVLR